MAQGNLLELLLKGTAPKSLRLLIAKGSVPVLPKETLALLVFLLNDSDSEVSSCAAGTLSSWNKDEIAGYLKDQDCAPAVLEHFASDTSESILASIIANPASPARAIQDIALSVPSRMLEKILDNRVRILEHPEILDSIKRNPQVSSGILRLVQEIEAEFFHGKKTDYAVEESARPAPAENPLQPEPAAEIDDFSLEGLPVDPEEREAELNKRLSSMSVPEKIKRALFGNREVRMVLIRETNREIARSVLRSPKITENEIETIAAMRGVAEDILREIGNSKEWTKSYSVVQNLVRNPKTPPTISQRLLFRLRAVDLLNLTRDRSLPDAVRYNATRALIQRTGPK